MPLTVYLAGPMTGLPRFNFPAFDQAAQALRAAGYRVINPAEQDRAIGFDELRHSTDDFLRLVGGRASLARKNLESVIACDLVSILPDSERSVGVNFERAAALRLGKPVRRLSALLELSPQAVAEREQETSQS